MSAPHAPSRSARALGKGIAKTPSPTPRTAAGSQPVTIREGIVQSVDATSPPTVTITLGASAVPIPMMRYDQSYTPSGGDRVKVIRVGDERWIMGALQT